MLRPLNNFALLGLPKGLKIVIFFIPTIIILLLLTLFILEHLPLLQSILCIYKLLHTHILNREIIHTIQTLINPFRQTVIILRILSLNLLNYLIIKSQILRRTLIIRSRINTLNSNSIFLLRKNSKHLLQLQTANRYLI